MSDLPGQSRQQGTIRAFLDANVLLSAALRPDGGASKRWGLAGVSLVTSEFAAKEAWDNLDSARVRTRGDPAAARERLVGLLGTVEIMEDEAERLTGLVLGGWALGDPKDGAILLGAINAGCSFLLTSDSTHFGAFFGRSMCGVTVVPPGRFLELMGRPDERPERGRGL